MELVNQSKKSFDAIRDDIRDIQVKIDEEYNYMDNITTSNNEITQRVSYARRTHTFPGGGSRM